MPFKTLVLLGALLLPTALAQSSTMSPERELLERAVAPLWGPTSVRTTVLVRQSPADLGFALPQGSRVVGSVRAETGNPDFPGGVTVYFDTRLTPAQVDTHFARVLGQAGWKAFPLPPDGPNPEGGFLPTTPIGGRPYYREKPDQRLTLQTRAVGDVTQVTLSRQDLPNLAQELRYARTDGGSPFGRLPRLLPPAGATVTPRGGGGGGDSVTMSAGIESTLSRTALFDHYAAQLKQAGWTLRNRADTGALTTTLWTLREDGRERLGLLILNETARGQYRGIIGIQGLE
ncbi:hypothetical protein [Deinococcus aestuarii]|uniref:hypothetical protein n=1 Tax=Deinococcus aestuarii TaxID=2774531 RepID=UPI001C0B123C|nr:hypothetical protein [Deinococcus aestuarii]